MNGLYGEITYPENGNLAMEQNEASNWVTQAHIHYLDLILTTSVNQPQAKIF